MPPLEAVDVAQIRDDHAQLVKRVRELEVAIGNMDDLLHATLVLAVGGTSGTFKSLIELQDLVRSGGGDATSFDSLIERLRTGMGELSKTLAKVRYGK